MSLVNTSRAVLSTLTTRIARPGLLNYEQNSPLFHSFIEVCENLAKLRGVKASEIPQYAITQIALTLELAFYFSNPKIAGKSDKHLYEVVLVQEPFRQYTLLNLNRNAKAHVKGGYRVYPPEGPIPPTSNN